MKILVTGATGNLGSKVVNELLKTISASQVAVSIQNLEKAEGLKALGVEIRQGNYSQPETLDFSGIDRLLFISTPFGIEEERISKHKNVVAEAQRAGVRFIAYTSATKASTSNAILAPVHRATEEMIKKTNIPYSFLRDNMYLENEIQSIQAALAGMPWITSVGTGKAGWALRQDFAEAIAKVLTGGGHENTIYELTGKSITVEELVSALENVSGKEITVQHVDDAGYTDILKGAGVPEALIPALVEMQKDIRIGEYEVESNDFEKITGHPFTSINDALSQIVRQFS
jgi:NAD(P)H dehydrogenase (quinone)